MIEGLNSLIGAVIPLLLILAGIFYGIRLKFFHLFKPRAIFRALTEKTVGGVSSFRALTLALAGTLGVGNIVGVSAAIAMGGFGSIFWMWVSAFCAMLLKYAEIVLAMRYRTYDPKGSSHGSAMLYIRAFFAKIGYLTVGRVLAGGFALLCIINAVSMGSIIQVNAISRSFSGVFNIPPTVTGAVLAVITLVVITRGTDGILRFTDKLVPLMTVGYIVLSAAVLILRADRIPYAFAEILGDAFSKECAVGGIGGFLISKSARYGVMRGLVSNEAGCGTAPTAHAVSNCDEPARQGVWGIFEVFADTVVLCTVTALVIIVSFGDAAARESDFMMMTVRSYSVVLGDVAAYFMAVAVLLFGFATVVCWAHYGKESVVYLSQKKIFTYVFSALYTVSVFIGAFAESGAIWQMADLAIGLMTLINVFVICAMSGEVKYETDLWIAKCEKKKK